MITLRLLLKRNGRMTATKSLFWVGLVALGLGLLNGPTSLQAQTPDPPLPTPDYRRPATEFNAATSLRFGHLTIDNGLPNSHVEAVLQDRQGFMWFGTWEGLVRYDGYRFINYTTKKTDANSLSSNVVIALLEDRDGLIWIGTRGGGLNRFDPATERFTRYMPDPARRETSLSDLFVNSLSQDRDGMIWMGTTFGQLNRLDPATQTFTHYKLPACAEGNPRIKKVLADRASDQVWVLTDGLFKFESLTGQFSCYPLPTAPAGFQTRLSDIGRGADGRLWLTGSTGLYQFDPPTGQITTYPLFEEPTPNQPNPKPARLNALAVAEDGRVWAGSEGAERALFVFDPRTGRYLARYKNEPTQPDSLNNSPINTIYQSRKGVLWIGTASAGVSLLNLHQTQFTTYPRTLEGFPKTPLQAIYQEPGGPYWLASPTTMTRFDPTDRSFRQYPVYTRPLPEIPTNTMMVSSIYPDAGGGLWFDGVDGLYRFDRATQQVQVYPLPPGAGPPLGLQGLAADSGQNLWVLTERTLYRFDMARRQFEATTFDLRSALPPTGGQARGLSLIAARNGEVWVGGEGFLLGLNPQTGQFKPYVPDPTNPAAIPAAVVEQVHEDEAGNLWLATPVGLVRFDRQKAQFSRYTQEDGLPSNSINAILADRQANLWLSTARGLSRFNPQTGQFRNYAARDGLQGNLFNTFATFKNSQGDLMFGGPDGLTVFDPQAIQDDAFKPPVVLTEVQLNDQSLSPAQGNFLKGPLSNGGRLELDYDQNMLSFEFAALDYVAPQTNRYRYYLEGRDARPIEVDSTKRQVNYTSLPPGSYTFRVQGTNSDGVWSDAQVVLRLVINPPWWETLWFRALALLAGIGLLGWGIYWRLSSVERRNRVLERQVVERTSELEQAKEQAEAANRLKSVSLAALKKANLELQRLSVLDSLTQIANRRRFDQYLQSQWEATPPAPLSLLLCDIDYFKRYNDNYGHPAGDLCLQSVAKAISQAVGYSKDLVARYGGEEFAIILPDTDQAGALRVAHAVLDQLHTLRVPHLYSEAASIVTLSIGLATLLPTPQTAPGELLAAADAALYQAKEQGRDRVVVTPAATPLRHPTTKDRAVSQR